MKTTYLQKRNNEIYTMKNLWLLRVPSQQSEIVANSDQSPKKHEFIHQQLKIRNFLLTESKVTQRYLTQGIYASSVSQPETSLYCFYNGRAG